MIISILHTEKELQVKDLTRFDASKSVAVKGTVNPINSVKIKPGADGTDIEVFVSGQPAKTWYVDFAFAAYAFDVDSSNNKLSFEANGTTYNTNAASGTYNLTTLLAAIKAAIEAVASPLTVSFSVDERNRITFTASGPLKLLPKKTSADLLQHIGFQEDGQETGFPVEYGIRKVTLTVASSSESTAVDEYIKVYSKEGDSLFSEDADLVGFENDIMKWLPQGRGSFLDLHRKAQKTILDWCDRQGYRDDEKRKLTKWAFVDQSDVRMWSTYLVLKLFFMGVQNATDDVFKNKANYYHKLEIEARDRAVLNLDLDGDGEVDVTRGPAIRSGELYFR